MEKIATNRVTMKKASIPIIKSGEGDVNGNCDLSIVERDMSAKIKTKTK